MDNLLINKDSSNHVKLLPGSSYQLPSDNQDLSNEKVIFDGNNNTLQNGIHDLHLLMPSNHNKYTSKPQSFLKSKILDLILLSLLGSIMAILSFGIDICIHKLLNIRELFLYYYFDGYSFIQFLIWLFYAIILVTTSAAICHHFGPHARGSGFPEIKISIRGIFMKEFYTVRTFITKIIALPLFVGSGSPIGKEAPFVHLSSIMAHQLSKISKRAISDYINESRKSEMLAAGCAVGIACTFGSPVGAVFYAMEATNIYFETYNVKRCLLAAIFSSTLYRILINFNDSTRNNGIFSTITATYQTNFPKHCYTFLELPLFAFLGFICGLFAVIYLFFQRKLTISLKNNKFLKFCYTK
jgi:chloride channel 2